MKNNKIYKNEILKKVAKKSKTSYEKTQTIYNELLEEIINNITEGKCVVMSGFGSFYLQRHKGHKGQFKNGYNKNGDTTPVKVDDYVVVKYRSSDVLNSNLRKQDKKKKFKTFDK